MARAFLDLGSNVEREASVALGLRLLRERFRVVRVSSVYESPAVGGGPDFHNLAVEIETDLEPADLRRALREIEARAGRVRTADRYAPRTLDLDLTLYGDRVEEGLPHPQVADQAFVLVPLSEIAPDLVHPVLGRRLADLAAELTRSGCDLRRRPGSAP